MSDDLIRKCIESTEKQLHARRAAVQNALNNAVENGYGEFVRMSPVLEVAQDLVNLDAALEDEMPEHLVDDIVSWRKGTWQ